MSGLRGKRVLVLRPERHADDAARLLEKHGAVPIVVPAIEVGPPTHPEALHEALMQASLASIDWVVFTSAAGVESVFAALGREGRGATAFEGARTAVVGPATAKALAAVGVAVDLAPTEFRGEALASALLAATGPAERRVLVFRAEEGSDALPLALRAAGADVRLVPAYTTRAYPPGVARARELLEGGGVDVVVFSSGSTVNAVCDALPSLAPFSAVTVACIGPVTAAAAAARTLQVDVVPDKSTMTATVEALERFLRAI